MEEVKYAGKLKRYLQAPIYMIGFFVIGNAVMYFYNVKYGVVTSAAIALYFLLVFEGYR